MADITGKKLTDPSIPTGTELDGADVSHVVDKSDTTDGIAGTSKRYAWLTIYNWILSNLNAALRLIPAGGTVGQSLTKVDGTDYNVTWANSASTVEVNAPLTGDGSSGAKLSISLDSTPTDGSANLVTSDGIYDAILASINTNQGSVINISYASMAAALSSNGIVPKAQYRITDSANGIVRVWGVSTSTVTAVAFLEGLADNGTFNPGAYGNYDIGVDVFTASGGSLQAAYDIGNTIEGFDVVIDDTSNNVSITKGATVTGTYVIALGTVAADSNTGNYVNAIGESSAFENTGSNVNAIGEKAAANNTGNNVNAIGDSAAGGNSGSNVNAIGSSAAGGNAGNKVNAIGSSAAEFNTGSNVNAIGTGAAGGNSGSNVNAIGENAAGGNSGSNVNAIGENAATSNALSNMTIIGTSELSTYADHTAALLAINTGTGATAGHYLYINASTNSIGCVTIF